MSLKAPSPYSATLGVRTSPCELGERWGNTNTQYHSVLSDSLWPHGLYSPWNSPGQNTGVGSFSLQGIFPTQGSNPGLLHCGWILYQLSHKGSPRILEWVACPFSSRSSRPRNWTRVSCTAGGFFTNRAIREALVYIAYSQERRELTLLEKCLIILRTTEKIYFINRFTR